MIAEIMAANGNWCVSFRQWVDTLYLCRKKAVLELLVHIFLPIDRFEEAFYYFISWMLLYANIDF